MKLSSLKLLEENERSYIAEKNGIEYHISKKHVKDGILNKKARKVISTDTRLREHYRMQSKLLKRKKKL